MHMLEVGLPRVQHGERSVSTGAHRLVPMNTAPLEIASVCSGPRQGHVEGLVGLNLPFIVLGVSCSPATTL